MRRRSFLGPLEGLLATLVRQDKYRHWYGGKENKKKSREGGLGEESCLGGVPNGSGEGLETYGAKKQSCRQFLHSDEEHQGAPGKDSTSDEGQGNREKYPGRRKAQAPGGFFHRRVYLEQLRPYGADGGWEKEDGVGEYEHGQGLVERENVV